MIKKKQAQNVINLIISEENEIKNRFHKKNLFKNSKTLNYEVKKPKLCTLESHF